MFFHANLDIIRLFTAYFKNNQKYAYQGSQKFILSS